MKKYFVAILFIGFLFSTLPVSAIGVKKNTNKSERPDSREIKQKKKKDDLAEKQRSEISSNMLANEQRKKEIESKELLVDKKMKVKMFGVDENLSQNIQKRNIP